MKLVYSKESVERLATADPRLQLLFTTVLGRGWDHRIDCGHREQKEQDEAFARGASKVKWPNGKHNSLPSKAVDAPSYPVQYDKQRYYAQQCLFAGYVLAVWDELKAAGKVRGIIRWGHDWNKNRSIMDENGLVDTPHFEIEEE